MTLGQRLRTARERLKKKQSDIVAELGWPQSKVSDVENDRQLPKLNEVLPVSWAYGVPLDELFDCDNLRPLTRADGVKEASAS